MTFKKGDKVVLTTNIYNTAKGGLFAEDEYDPDDFESWLYSEKGTIYTADEDGDYPTFIGEDDHTTTLDPSWYKRLKDNPNAQKLKKLVKGKMDEGMGYLAAVESVEKQTGVPWQEIQSSYEWANNPEIKRFEDKWPPHTQCPNCGKNITYHHISDVIDCQRCGYIFPQSNPTWSNPGKYTTIVYTIGNKKGTANVQLVNVKEESLIETRNIIRRDTKGGLLKQGTKVIVDGTEYWVDKTSRPWVNESMEEVPKPEIKYYEVDPETGKESEISEFESNLVKGANVFFHKSLPKDELENFMYSDVYEITATEEDMWDLYQLAKQLVDENKILVSEEIIASRGFKVSGGIINASVDEKNKTFTLQLRRVSQRFTPQVDMEIPKGPHVPEKKEEEKKKPAKKALFNPGLYKSNPTDFMEAVLDGDVDRAFFELDSTDVSTSQIKKGLSKIKKLKGRAYERMRNFLEDRLADRIEDLRKNPDKSYYEEVAKEMGGKLKKFKEGKEKRDIEIKLPKGLLTITQRWNKDGSSTKPVTYLLFNEEEYPLGRFAIWDDPSWYAKDIQSTIEE